MKVELKEEGKGFQPIELTITIETEQELCSLYGRLNASVFSVSESSDECIYRVRSLSSLFAVVNKLTKENNLLR